MIKDVDIAGRILGPGRPPLVVAELSGNHNGELDRALALVDAAADAGADAVKLQTYTADTITLDCDGPGFVIEGGPWDGRSLYELYQEAATPWDWHDALFARARERGLIAFSSPFDDTAVAFLEGLGAPAHKIASFEIVDIPLIERAAATGRPVIISTGMSSDAEVRDAVAAAQGGGAAGVIVLHCNSGYPTPLSDCNLRTIDHLRDLTGVAVGLSDHTLGTAVACAATALGAVMIEKHITLSRADGGPDAGFSLEPEEFARLCRDCRDAFAALGAPRSGRTRSEATSRPFRRSLYAVEDIAAGAPLTRDNVRSIRPAFGLPPKVLPEVLGKRAARAIARGTPLSWDLIGGTKAGAGLGG